MREYKSVDKLIEYIYKGFKVCGQKEKCLSGHQMIYYQIYDKDGVEVISTFTEDSSVFRKYINELRELVDDIIENLEDYYEEQ